MANTLLRRLAAVTHWFFPMPYIWISTVIYSGVLLTYTLYHLIYSIAPVNTPLLVAIMLALLALDRFEVHAFGGLPPRHIALLFLAYRVVLVELAGLHLDIYYLSFLYAFLPFLAVMQLGWRAGSLVALIVWLIYLLKLSYIYPWWTLNVIHVDAVLTFHIMLAFTMTMAKVLLREQHSRQDAESLAAALERSNVQLREYAEQVEMLAIMQERSRLARDIHDTLGHYLTAMSIQLEKATVIQPRQPEVARASVQRAKSLADEALREVRHSVGMLRSGATGFALQEALERLIGRMTSASLDIRLSVEGNPDQLAEPLLMSLYRAAQEGLTNVQKHAAASKAHLKVIIREGQVQMVIEDNGRGFDPETVTSAAGSGYGLRGLRERLRLLGGSLDVSSQPGVQTQLKISIPRGAS